MIWSIIDISHIIDEQWGSDIHSDKAERGFNLMNIIYMSVRNSLPVDYKSDLIILNLLGKEWCGIQIHLSNHAWIMTIN